MSQQLRDWLNSHDETRRAEVAGKAATSVGYLWQLAGGHRKASLELAKRLQDVTDGELTIEGLRPDVFSKPTPSTETAPAADKPAAPQSEADHPKREPGCAATTAPQLG